MFAKLIGYTFGTILCLIFGILGYVIILGWLYTFIQFVVWAI